MNPSPNGAHPLLASCTKEDRQVLLAALVREAIGEAGAGKAFPLHEGGKLLGYFVPVGEGIHPLPPEGTLEFAAEMRRRMESPEPCLSEEEFQRWWAEL